MTQHHLPTITLPVLDDLTSHQLTLKTARAATAIAILISLLDKKRNGQYLIFASQRLAIELSTMSSMPRDPHSTSICSSTSDSLVSHSRRRLLPPNPQAGITIAKNGLETALNLFGLSKIQTERLSWSNAIIVAIDFENASAIKHDTDLPNFQVGLAILDLGRAQSCPPENLIKTHNFASGSPAYCQQAAKRFLFGKTHTVQKKDMIAQIELNIPEDREIILVGHDIRHDLIALDNLRWTFNKAVIAILDTYRMSGQVLPFFALRLVELLRELNCSSIGLHCAGNDAYFTLRALLLLAARGGSGTATNSQNLPLLQSIASSPVQRRLFQHEVGVKRRQKDKQKRRERTKKYQSQFWDDETKDKIRAERAAKKLANATGP